MTKKSTPYPHDSFFKLLMDSGENVAELLSSSLPAPITSKLDFSTLRNMNTSFTDGNLDNFRADVLYECRTLTGTSVVITLLLEHKSYREKYPHLQMLKYMARIWTHDIKNKRKPRKILPILFYHGQKKWRYRPFIEYLEGGDTDPEFLPFIPSFDYFFLNLQEKENDWIRDEIGDLALRIALMLMKAIRSPDLLEMLERIFEGSDELKKTEKGRQQIEEILLYLNIELESSDEKMKAAMDHETYMRIMPIPENTPIGRLLQKEKKAGQEQGKKDGIAEGKAEGKAEVAVNLLKAGIEIDQVVSFTGFSYREVEKMQESLD